MKNASDTARHFDAACRRCARLVAHLGEVRQAHPDYHAAPVAPFGDARARLLVVGLAPGMHGANASGRPFTGDHAGILLYETLYRHGLASAPTSVRGDELRLLGCRITNAVKCLPPANKPLGEEISACNDYLAHELADLPAHAVVIALGRIAHDAVLRALGEKRARRVFAHGAVHAGLGRDLCLVDSYHCSRYNTQTRRLTGAMFDAVFAQALSELDSRAA
jgi:uracil-DNA glycosylase